MKCHGKTVFAPFAAILLFTIHQVSGDEGSTTKPSTSESRPASRPYAQLALAAGVEDLKSLAEKSRRSTRTGEAPTSVVGMLTSCIANLRSIIYKRDQVDPIVIESLTRQCVLLGAILRMPQAEAEPQITRDILVAYSASWDKTARDIAKGGNGAVTVSVTTISPDNKEVSGFRVRFLDEGTFIYLSSKGRRFYEEQVRAQLNDLARDFDYVSSPTEQKMVVGDYVMWTAKGDIQTLQEHKSLSRREDQGVTKLSLVTEPDKKSR